MDVDKRVLAVAVIALLVVGAGVYFVFLDEPTGDEIALQVEERYDEIEDYEGAMTVNSVRMAQEDEPMSEEEIQQEAQIAAERQDDLSYDEALEVIRANQPDGEEVEIFNQTTVAEVQYAQPDRHRYDYVTEPSARVSDVVAVVTKDNTAYYFQEGGGPPTDGELWRASVSTIGIPLGDYVPKLTEEYELEVNETLTDDETYILDLTPHDEDALDLHLDRLWVDRQTMLPVRAYRLSLQTDPFGEPTGDYTEQTVEYDYEYDVGVDEDVFDIGIVEVSAPEPPERETEPDLPEQDEPEDRFDERIVERLDSIESAEEMAGFNITEPEHLPADVEFVGATVRIEDDVSTIDPLYESRTDNLLMRYTYDFRTISSDFGVGDDSPYSVEEIDVNGTTVTLISSGVDQAPAVASFECGDMTVEATSATLPEESLVDVLASVNC